MSSADTPVTLLAGYLGSGKTTLVNHVLRQANGLRIAVMVNDFGDLPIDASLIVANDEDIIQLSGGCVCCSYGNDLVRALARLEELPNKPQHILIECSGVALPKPVRSSLSLLQGLSYDGTVGLVDGAQVLQQLSDRYIGDTVARQIAQADIIVINKRDLLTTEQYNKVRAKVREFSEQQVVAVASAEIAIEVVLSSRLSDTEDCLSTAENLPHAQFESVVIRSTEGVLLSRLTAQLTHSQTGVLRAKGYVKDPEGQMHLLQMVGSISRITPLPAEDNKFSSTAFVIIGVKGQLRPELIVV